MEEIIAVLQMFVVVGYLVLMWFMIDKIKEIKTEIKRLKQELEALEADFINYKRTKHKEEVLKNICYAVSKYNN